MHGLWVKKLSDDNVFVPIWSIRSEPNQPVFPRAFVNGTQNHYSSAIHTLLPREDRILQPLMVGALALKPFEE